MGGARHAVRGGAGRRGAILVRLDPPALGDSDPGDGPLHARPGPGLARPRLRLLDRSVERDPLGIYLGGNEMATSPLSLLAFGELYRPAGTAPDGAQVLPPNWIPASWQTRTHSRFTGDGYGFGWFMHEIGGRDGTPPVKAALCGCRGRRRAWP